MPRNPGLSRVAVWENNIVGTVLCSHDGRRAFLYHLAVKPDFRRHGIGGALVEACVNYLARCGIPRTTIHLFPANESGIKICQSKGWHFRPDLAVMQIQPDLLLPV